MVVAIVLILLVVGSLIFHFASPWWFTPIASNWGTIDDTIILTFWVTGIVFVLLNLFLAWCILKFRHRKDHKAHYEPENHKLEIWLTGITTVGVVAMLAPGLIVWGDVVAVPDDAMEVEAVGQQWHWTFRYPGEDKVFGNVDPLLINVDNPFGMDPDDPAGADDVLVYSPEMHLPVNTPVKMLLRSKDVLHNYTVPQVRVKMDLVPGMVTYIWYETIREGNFEILCEELCGMAHHTMRGELVVESQEEFDAWLASYPTYAEVLSRNEPDATAGQAAYATCVACHGANGEGNPALNAPKLAGLDDWYLKRQLEHYKARIRGSEEGDLLGMQMQGMAATLFNEAAVDNVVAYIGTLPDTPAATTIQGDVEAGKELYETCVNCHGSQGQGIWAMNAPRMAGMSDWYVAQQLRNFRDGLRGVHPDDRYGRQMAQMAMMLNEEQEINDLIAYMNTLGQTELAAAEAGPDYK